MNYNIKIFIFLTLFIFIFFLFFPLDARALPLCKCNSDSDCSSGYWCNTDAFAVGRCVSLENIGLCDPCPCYDDGKGWHDTGTCSGSSDDPNNPCSPFIEQEYCDGCFWSGIRCIGNPPICASGQTECRTGDQVFECDGDRCGWRLKEDCDDSDGCVGTTYRDYSCSGGSCTYTDSGYDSRCNNPPDIPTLETPLHNVWIDYNPTFKAMVSDPDGEMVRAHFNIVGYGSGVGTLVESGGISEWGPVNLGDCAEYSWRSYAEDATGLESGWYGYWLVKVDKGAPNSSIDYPTGTIDYTTLTINLTESGGCFGVVEGDVDIDISTNGGTTWSGWQDHLSAIDDFNYTGSDGYCYKFRYQVKNEKDNWSAWAEGEEACIQLAPSCECSSSDGPCCKDDCNFNNTSTVCDTETGYQCSGTECGADFQSRTRDRYCSSSAAACTGSYGSWSGWSTVEDCTDLQLCYTTSPYCRDNLSCIAANTPNIPTTEAPPDDTWINYDPTFKATATDPDDDDVRIYFSVSDSGDGWGSWVNSGGASQWGPTDLGTCAQHSWRAYSEDTDGFKSDWSGYWQVNVDKDAPNGSISYSTGSICGAFRVTLTESDDCSSISQGEIEISINGGDWQDYTNTVDDFDYTGSDGYSYKFRYRVQDSAGNWSNWSIGEEVPVINCDDFDSCVGTTYRNYSCSEGGCIYNDKTCDSYCNASPDVPILQVPSNDSWLNYDPIFKAGVSDPDEDDVRAYFNVSDYGDNWGEQTRSGEVGQLGPVNLGACAEYWWRVYSQDTCGFNSDWTGYWKVKVDKDLPSNSIDYPDGAIYSNTFTVTLNESDDCSGIKGGDVDLRIDSGDWHYFRNTIDNFDFVGSYGHSYQLRYRVKDNADNWSDFAGDEIVELRALPEVAPIGVDWICCPELKLVFSWEHFDLNGSPQAGFQIQIDDNNDFSSPVIDTGEILDSQVQYFLTEDDISKLSEEIEYFWQIRVKNAYGDWSEWKTNESLLIFIKELETYSTKKRRQF